MWRHPRFTYETCPPSDGGRLTQVVPGAENDDRSVLALHGLLHILLIRHVPHHHSARLVVGGQLGGVAHQNGHIVS